AAFSSNVLPTTAEYVIIGKYPDCSLGQPTVETSRAAAAALEEVVTLARRGELDAVVHGPIHRGRIYEAGLKFVGQTEFFADRCGAKNFAMCLTGGKLMVALVTTHIPLNRVSDMLKHSEIVRVGLLLVDLLDRRSNNAPRIAVAGLSPHAGGSGKIGREALEVITPATDGREP